MIKQTPMDIAFVEAEIRAACGWTDSDQPTVLVKMTQYFGDTMTFEFWVTRNVYPQSINFCPRVWTFWLPAEYLKDTQYLMQWSKSIKEKIFP